MLNNLIYILIFLPLFGAAILQLSGRSKYTLQVISFSSLILMLVISVMVAIESFALPKIESDLSFDIISIPIEFRINLTSSIVMIFLIAIKIAQLILFQGEFSEKLKIEGVKMYFTGNLLSCFAIIGIIATNNIFNLFIFIELHFISYFALSMASKNKKIDHKNSRQLILNCAASMLFLISIIALYFHFETLKISDLISKIDLSNDKTGLVETSCLLILVSLLVRFVPLQAIFSKNIKDSFVMSRELFFLLFINLNLLIHIILKMYHVIFSSNLVTSIIVFSCAIVTTYSSILMIFSRHLRSQITSFCFSIFCLIILSLALKNQSSFQASFFYILSYNICALFIFFFVTYISTRHNISTIGNIKEVSVGFFGRNAYLLFTIITILSAPLPYSPIFYANFFLFDAILDNNDSQLYEFSNFFDPYILIAILLFYIGSLIFFFKIITSLTFAKTESIQENNRTQDNSPIFCLVNLVGVVILFYVTINIARFKLIIDKFSENIFNIL